MIERFETRELMRVSGPTPPDPCVLCGHPWGVDGLVMAGPACRVNVCAACAPVVLDTLSEASGLDFSQIARTPPKT